MNLIIIGSMEDRIISYGMPPGILKPSLTISGTSQISYRLEDSRGIPISFTGLPDQNLESQIAFCLEALADDLSALRLDLGEITYFVAPNLDLIQVLAPLGNFYGTERTN